MQIVVGGCLAQKDRDLIVERAPHVDVVFGTHNVGRAAELLAAQRDAGRSLVEILEETVVDDHDAFPSALPARREVAYAGWVTIQIGCDNSLRLLHRAGRPGQGDQPAVRRASSTRSGRWPPTA